MFPLKYIVSIVVILIVTLTSTYFITKKFTTAYIDKIVKKEAAVISNKKVTQLYIDILDHQEIVRSIASNKLFNEFLSKKDCQCMEYIEDIFMTISTPNRYLFQLRYIDKNGKEVIRVDKTHDNRAFLVAKEKLQNKKNRYYFQEAMALDKGAIWYSKVDLNIEHGKIEKPIRPTLRIATPVFDRNNEIKGIVIANISIKQFFHKLSRDEKFNMFIIDEQGEYLYHKDTNYSWSKYLKNDKNILKELAGLDRKNLQKRKHYYSWHYFQKLYLDNKEGLLLALKPKSDVIENMRKSYQNSVLLYTILVLIVIVLVIVIVYSYRDKKQKEQVLEAQKMASMGEMIGNIAHQWRQPLSVISTAATGMQLKSEYGMLEKDELEKNCSNINDNAQYLSKTIDDFRNFIKGDKSKAVFKVTKEIDSLLILVEGSIKTHDIHVVQNIEATHEIFGYENELLQCFINIFNNAKDVLNEKSEDKFLFITSYLESKDICIEFKDNGGGVDEAIIENLFEPYFTTKHQGQGTGLGLYMSYNIIESMDGELEVENQTYSYNGKTYKGAVFTVKIPLEKI